jgi:hypothetical protein
VAPPYLLLKVQEHLQTNPVVGVDLPHLQYPLLEKEQIAIDEPQPVADPKTEKRGVAIANTKPAAI